MSAHIQPVQTEKTIKLMYFAWVRERIGIASETLTLPARVTTITDLIAHLTARGENYAYAFEQGALIRAALDQKHVKHHTPIGNAHEIAFFPPMTGG